MNSRIPYRNIRSMGTQMDIVFPNISDEQVDSAILDVKNELERLEGKLSVYRKDSDFSKINNYGIKQSIALDDEVTGLISTLISYNNLSNGFFDFTLGNISSKNYSAKELKYFLNLKIEERIKFEEVKREIKLLHPMVSMDSGSFGKGIALDSVKKILEKNKIKDSFISFGGSSVLGMGKHTAADYWPVGIADFHDLKKNMYIFKLRNSVLSISGNTVNNMKKYPEGHIINPKTGKFVQGLVQLCVSGTSAFVAEILSTALFSMSDDQILKVLDDFPGYKAVKMSFNKEKGQNEIIEF